MAIDEETLKAFSGVYDIEQPSYDRVITLDHMKEPVPNPLLDKDDVCAVVQINARGGEGPYAVAFDLLNDWAAGDVYEIREYRRHEWRDEHGATMSTWDQTGYLGDVYLGGERDWTAAFDDPGDMRDAALAAMPDMPAVPTAAPDVHGAVR